MAKVTITARVFGAAEVARAFRALPPEARRELDQTKDDLAQRLARLAKAAAQAHSRQAARVAPTVRPNAAGAGPAIVAGPHPFLFASEFGAGPWYGRNWRENGQPSNGQWKVRRPSGYWFFPTVEDNRAMIDAAWSQACDAIIRSWSA